MKTFVLLLGPLAAWGVHQDPSPQPETLLETYPDGSPRLEAEGVRAEGGEFVLDGKYVRFYPDGSRECVGRYRDGERHGSWRFLYPGGDQKRAEGSFRGGWRNGRWKAWTPDGKFDESESGTYRQLASEPAQGVVAAEGETLDHVPHGRWELAWPSGSAMASGELRRGRMHGTWRFRHEDGSLDPDWITGVYEDGRRVGDVPVDELPEATEPDLLGLPPLDAEAKSPVGVLEAAHESAEALRERLADSEVLGEESLWELRHLRILGRDADAVRLAPLLGADFADPAQAQLAVRWEAEVLGDLTGGAGFGLRAGTDPEDLAWNRWCTLRWYSLLRLAQLDPYALELEFAHPYLRPDEDPQVDIAASMLSRRTPALPIPGLDSDAARAAMHPLVAARLPSARASIQTWGRPGAQALEAALAWLVEHQAPDGRWAAAEFMHFIARGRICACDGPGQSIHDVGVTSLALLALMGDGSSPRHGPHAAAVRRGLAFLLSAQDDEGVLGGSKHAGFIYDHAIATQALGEAAALCDAESVRVALASALEVCIEARNPYSGWRYDLTPQNENDTSVTGWMVAALKTAEEAGLQVERAAYEGALSWIDKVTDTATGRCGYDTKGSYSARIPEVNDFYPPEEGEAMTAIALASRLRIAPEADGDAIHQKSAELLLRCLPEWTPVPGPDMYYWLHGSEAMARRGGSDWSVWYHALGKAVITGQSQDGDSAGSWPPSGPWGFAGGRVYATALMALCLEAPFRHQLPSADD